MSIKNQTGIASIVPTVGTESESLTNSTFFTERRKKWEKAVQEYVPFGNAIDSIVEIFPKTESFDLAMTENTWLAAVYSLFNDTGLYTNDGTLILNEKALRSSQAIVLMKEYANTIGIDLIEDDDIYFDHIKKAIHYNPNDDESMIFSALMHELIHADDYVHDIYDPAYLASRVRTESKAYAHSPELYSLYGLSESFTFSLNAHYMNSSEFMN